MPHILLWSPMDAYLADVLATIPSVRVTQIGSIDELAAHITQADGMVMLGHFYTAPVAELLRDSAPRLRWVQLTTAGYDGVTFHGVPLGVTVTNAGHSHSPMVAEHAIMLLTALTRRLPLYHDAQRRHVFDRSIRPATLEESTVCILGYGGIGRQIAVRAKAFGANVIAVARTARSDDVADTVYGREALLNVLTNTDALVIAAALTPETRGIIGTAALAALHPGALLINVARGPIVDTAALIDALHSGRLAGAGLDVTDPEPPPPDHPLWSCPNLIITPHVSGVGSQVVRKRIAEVVKENALRFVGGQDLLHRVAE